MKNLIIIGLVFSVLLFAGCTGPLPPPTEKTGKLMLSITDKKVDGLESLYVTISSVELHMAAQEQEQNENYGWILFSEEEKTFDIMSLDSTQGLKDLLGEKTLENLINEKAKNDIITKIIKPMSKITLNQINGYTYTTKGFTTSANLVYYFFELPDGQNYIQIIDGSADPTTKTNFREISMQILSTFKFLD